MSNPGPGLGQRHANVLNALRAPTHVQDMGNNWFMDPTEFLARRVPGYANLDGDERHAIAEFSLLWPAFEGAILGTAASPSGLVEIGFKLRDAGRLDLARFAAPLAYFRNRYWRDGAFTPEYDGLHLKHYNQQNQKLVRETLSNVPLLPENVLGGLLLVVYRLRNNLFHGVKWAYGIKGQKPNFQNACVVLMAVMELHEGLN